MIKTTLAYILISLFFLFSIIYIATASVFPYMIIVWICYGDAICITSLLKGLVVTACILGFFLTIPWAFKEISQ